MVKMVENRETHDEIVGVESPVLSHHYNFTTVLLFS